MLRLEIKTDTPDTQHKADTRLFTALLFALPCTATVKTYTVHTEDCPPPLPPCGLAHYYPLPYPLDDKLRALILEAPCVIEYEDYPGQ